MNNETAESTTTTAGLVGFIVLFALAVACWLLYRSMNTHLRRVRYREEAERRAREEEAEDGPDGSDRSDRPGHVADGPGGGPAKT